MKKKQYISWDLGDSKKHNLFTLLLLRIAVCRFVRDFFLQIHIKMDNLLGLFFQISRKEHDIDKNKEDKFLALF